MPRLRRVLEQQRRFRLEQLAEMADQDQRAGLTNAGSHIDDLDASADSARTEVSAVVTAAAHRALEDIDAALDRIRAGRYGRCEDCGAEIPMQRLVVLPQVGLCMRCQLRAESGR